MEDTRFSLAPRSAGLGELIAQTKTFLQAAKTPATRKAYAADIRDYSDFYVQIGQPASERDGEAPALYISDLAWQGRKATTIDRRLAAIATEYHARGYRGTPVNSFVVQEVLRGIKRTIGTAQDCKAPLSVDDVEWIAASCPERLNGLRDRALMLFGFALGARRATLLKPLA